MGPTHVQEEASRKKLKEPILRAKRQTLCNGQSDVLGREPRDYVGVLPRALSRRQPK